MLRIILIYKVSRIWYKQAKRKEERYRSTEKKWKNMEESSKHEKACRSLQYVVVLNTDDVHETDSEDRDQDFVAALPIMRERPSSSSKNDPTSPGHTFPKIPVRTTRKCLDERIMT